jgi:glycosyltransferase involved in cell wall biosynthesis
MGGAVRHLTNFLPRLKTVDGEREYIVLTRDGIMLPPVPGVSIHNISRVYAVNAPARLAFEWLVTPFLIRRLGIGCVVSLTNFGPIWAGVPHVNFQRNPLYYCPAYLRRLNRKGRMVTGLRRAIAVATMRHATVIVTPSSAMAAMIRSKVTGLQESRFKTLYHAFSIDSIAAALDPVVRARVVAARGIRILYPTHPAPHKGFDQMFEILSYAKKNGADFTLFTTVERGDWPEGVKGYEAQVKALDLQDRVRFLGRVAQQQMGELYRMCDLMLYPSLCESFGFSMVEAMGCGLPIVAAGTSVNREICGDAAEYYEPEDPKDGWRVLSATMGDAKRAELRNRGLARSCVFPGDWDQYAQNFVAILESVGC